jgi:ATP-dependent Lon protease
MAFDPPSYEQGAPPNLPPELDLPILAIRNTVIFPVLAFPINVGRDKSLEAVERALAGDKLLGIVAQQDAKNEDPDTAELYLTGTVVKILKSVKMPGNKLNVIIQGLSRIKVERWMTTTPTLSAHVRVFPESQETSPELESMMATMRELAQKIIDLSPHIPSEASFLVRSIDNPGILADIVASNLSIGVEEKQELLDTLDTRERMGKVIALLNKELQVLELSQKIQTEVKGEMDKAQREYFLREQLKAIQKELGETDDRQEEFEEIKKGIKKARMPKEVEKVAYKELKRMSRMSPGAAEYTVSRTYIDWLVELPWATQTEDVMDVAEAGRILDADHYGLEKVKQRILEYLAVRKLKRDMKGPILCLVGPPGVGKTSLAKSVARALGRKMVRISLGGVRDEAEVRGHRRTYIGSLPGKVIKGIKKAGTNNPVFVLDEIDKLGADWRGDPTSALLEVLDPEQNGTFNDHYLEVDYDLSDVMFITTANSLRMPQPLLDRMEIIRIPGYTEDEKVEIAKRHLIPKQTEAHALKAGEWEIADEALRDLIRYYCREAGVRNLEREIANLTRKATKEIVTEKAKKVKVTRANLEKYAGVKKYRWGETETEDLVGVTNGLAWTEVGGELLSIEATVVPGKGKMTITGKLGDVMQESVQAAHSYVRSRATAFGIRPPVFDKKDIHVHVPEGATPKDGPSAGVAMITSIVSALTGIPVRRDLAMTGEITLRGRVLPIGGLKEKLLAALHSGLKQVLIPKENEKDLADIPDNVKKGLRIVPVSTVDEVIAEALTRAPIAIEWIEPVEVEAVAKKQEGEGGLVTH